MAGLGWNSLLNTLAGLDDDLVNKLMKTTSFEEVEKLLTSRGVSLLAPLPGTTQFPLNENEARVAALSPAQQAHIVRGVTSHPIPKQPGDPHHHFTLTKELIDAMGWDEVFATMKDMAELELLRAPYPDLLVTFPLDAMLNNSSWYVQDTDVPIEKCDVTFKMYDDFRMSYDKEIQEVVPKLNLDLAVRMRMDTGEEEILSFTEEAASDRLAFAGIMMTACSMAAGLLVVALATKNVAKHTAINNRVHRGIGNGKFKGPGGTVYVSTTKLDVPPSLGTGTGTSPKMHLRRGHPHTFLVGVGRTEKRQQYVYPILVNRDDSFLPPPVRDYTIKP